jgi:hypothetical protein
MTKQRCICDGCVDWQAGGGSIPLCRMSTSHLRNAVAWLRRGGEWGEYDVDSGTYFPYTTDSGYWIPALEAELERRYQAGSPYLGRP